MSDKVDKRKSNGGHSTKAVSPHDKRLNPYKALVRQAVTDDMILDVFKTLHEAATQKKDVQAAKLLLEYTVGKPTAQVEVKGDFTSLSLANLVSFTGGSQAEDIEFEEVKEDNPNE